MICTQIPHTGQTGWEQQGDEDRSRPRAVRRVLIDTKNPPMHESIRHAIMLARHVRAEATVAKSKLLIPYANTLLPAAFHPIPSHYQPPRPTT